MADDNVKLEIISEWFIKPKYEVEQSKIPHYLSPTDLYLLSTAYMHRGLIYTKPTTCFDINSFLNKLKESMSLALVHFYPLAGRLATIEYKDEKACSIYIDSNKGPGAKLIHAVTQDELTVSNIISCFEVRVPRYIWSFIDAGEQLVVNDDGHNRALLSVQVTELVDGVFLGFSMNHSVADGTSFWNFINALSEIFTRTSEDKEDNGSVINHGINSREPIFEPTYDGTEDGTSMIKLPHLDPQESLSHLEVDPRLRMRVFRFSATSIAKLKFEVNNNGNGSHDNNNSVTISSFQAFCAFVWKSISEARNLPPETDMSCLMAADIRNRMEPTMSKNHFGNLIYFTKASAKARELQLNGLNWVAMLLHQAIANVNDKTIRNYSKALAKSPRAPNYKDSENNKSLLMRGSTKFDLYGPEFGLGKAIADCPGYSAWINGSIRTNPGREGGGSVDLVVCLLSETMIALESSKEFMAYVS